MSRSVPLRLACLALPAAVWAVDLPPMAPTPGKPPPAHSADDMLVDRVIPAYGVRHLKPYRAHSRAEPLYHRVTAFAARVDAGLAAGSLRLPADGWVAPVDPQTRAPVPGGVPELVPAPLLPEEVELMRLTEELARLDARLVFPNHAEQWHLDAGFRDLARAGEGLSLALGTSRYQDLTAVHRAWMDHYQLLINQARRLRTIELMTVSVTQNPLPTLEGSWARAVDEITAVPFPAMLWPNADGVITYPEVSLTPLPATPVLIGGPTPGEAPAGANAAAEGTDTTQRIDRAETPGDNTAAPEATTPADTSTTEASSEAANPAPTAEEAATPVRRIVVASPAIAGAPGASVVFGGFVIHLPAVPTE